MNVRRFGGAGGAPFLFWHALGPDASGAYFADAGNALAGRGYAVFAVDGPGFGDSPALAPDEYRLASLAGRLREVVEEPGLERPVLAGHSWGGAVVVTYAAAHPDDVPALVLLDSGHIDYRELDGVDADKPVEAWIEDARQWPDPRNAEARAMAMRRRLARVRVGRRCRRVSSASVDFSPWR